MVVSLCCRALEHAKIYFVTEDFNEFPSYVDRPLFQNRRMQKVVTRGVQQVAINSAIS